MGPEGGTKKSAKAKTHKKIFDTFKGCRACRGVLTLFWDVKCILGGRNYKLYQISFSTLSLIVYLFLKDCFSEVVLVMCEIVRTVLFFLRAILLLE